MQIRTSPPGRGPRGYLRNFDAMTARKLRGVIAELEADGADPEALAAALAIAERVTPRAARGRSAKRVTGADKRRSQRTFEQRSASARKAWETRRANGWQHPAQLRAAE